MPEFKMPSAGLNEISDFIFEKHGRDISAFDPAYFKKSLDLRLKLLGLKNEGEYYALLCADEDESAMLLKSIYNTFSCFFRDGLVFSYIEQSILPALAAHKYDGEIRIWSSCCAAGQEVYSLAMLVSDFSDMVNKPLRCRIIATDITDDALAAAKKAVYDESAVLNVRLRHLKKYFKAIRNEYAVLPSLKRQIEFVPYDLLDALTAYPPESIYGSFDIVMCSNLLIYYRQTVQKRIIYKLINSLSEGGYLIVGETEKAYFDSPALVHPYSAPENIFVNSRGRVMR